jgi:transcription-repair coupling factor (superfamily II helicase)
MKLADYTIVSDSTVTLIPYDTELTETLEAVRSVQREREEEFIPRVPIVDWTELEEGDLVVHKEYGIGRYLGVRPLKTCSG